MNYIHAQHEFRNIPLNQIHPPLREVREVISEEKLLDLMNSISEKGLIQPIVVTVRQEGGYEVVAGDRRYMAAKKLNLLEIPCMIRYGTRQEMEMVKLDENFKREDVNPYDEGKFYQHLIYDLGLTAKDIADSTNRSAGYIASRLDLLAGDPLIAEAVRDAVIGIGVGLELNKITSADKRSYYLGWAIQTGVTIRLCQQWVRDANLDTYIFRPDAVPTTSEQGETEPTRMAYFCELCDKVIAPEQTYILRSCDHCKAALLRAKREMIDK